MGFRLALLVLFFLAIGLALRGLLRTKEKGGISGLHIMLGHLLALLFGVIISPQVFSVIDPTTKKGLVPILELSFGWVGFLFGFQFNITTLRRIPGSYIGRALAEALVAFAIAGFLGFCLLKAFRERLEFNEAEVFRTALALGAVLSISAPTLIAFFNKKIRVRSPLVNLLVVIASIDGLVGVFALGIINVIWHPAGLEMHLSVLLMILLGFEQAFLIWLLLRAERKAIPTAILGIGVLTLGAGMSAYFGLSPVVPGVLAGMIAANLAPGLRQRLARMLMTAESGLYIGLIVLTGVFLPSGLKSHVWVGVVTICIAGVFNRFLGKTLGATLVLPSGNTGVCAKTRFLFSCSLQSAGALILVVALCYNQTIVGSKPPLVVITALCAFVIGEIISIYATPRLLRELGKNAGTSR